MYIADFETNFLLENWTHLMYIEGLFSHWKGSYSACVQCYLDNIAFTYMYSYIVHKLTNTNFKKYWNVFVKMWFLQICDIQKHNFIPLESNYYRYEDKILYVFNIFCMQQTSICTLHFIHNFQIYRFWKALVPFYVFQLKLHLFNFDDCERTIQAIYLEIKNYVFSLNMIINNDYVIND